MTLLLDSFWRAAAYCLHPRVIALSLLPLVLMAGLALVLGYFFWSPAIDVVQSTLASWSWTSALMRWLDGIGLPGLRAALAPVVVLVVATPLIAIGALVAVATLMTPSILSLVAERRFPNLEKKQGGSFAGGMAHAVGASLAALAVLLLSMPLWFIPPLVLVIPPLVWGWLTYRVVVYDVLAEHASLSERQALLRAHRPALLGMGVLTGYLGTAPSLVWASGLLFIALAPVLVPLAVWIYTLVFAFSSLWYAHFVLAALQRLREQHGLRDGLSTPDAPPIQPPAPATMLPPP